MIVDQLIDWLPTSESWPGLTFIFVVILYFIVDIFAVYGTHFNISFNWYSYGTR